MTMVTIIDFMKKFRINLLTLFIIFYINSVPVFAGGCDDVDGGIGLDSANASLDCAQKNQNDADKILNDTYQRLISKLNSSQGDGRRTHAKIVSVQRAWIAYRDAECDFRVAINGGAPQWQEVNRLECITELTQNRVESLKNYLMQIR